MLKLQFVGKMSLRTRLLLARCLDLRVVQFSTSAAKTIVEDVPKENKDNSSSSTSSVNTPSGSWLEKLCYNSFLEKYTYHPTYKQRLGDAKKQKLRELKTAKKLSKSDSTSVAFKYLDGIEDLERSRDTDQEHETLQMMEDDLEDSRFTGAVQFPYQIVTEETAEAHLAGSEQGDTRGNEEAISNEEGGDDEPPENVDLDEGDWAQQYGSPNPDVPASDVPCGGCGALLHCQDTGLPGYMPSERFVQFKPRDLRSEICQRCYFLKAHNAALSVNVSPKVYPKILSQMKDKRGLVILMVDLIDFPCSIWPGIPNIIGEKRPVVLVGNKVDLIPRDSKKYLYHIKECLKQAAADMGIDRCRIIHTTLISASTGYGVEDLIDSLLGLWDHKDDFYILGCTNVGKSTLFNTLLQSDLCKVKAVDLVRRATVSQWPGTTLQLLKFPVLFPSGWERHLRYERMKDFNQAIRAERELNHFQLKQTKNPFYASLIGRVGRSYRLNETPEQEFWMDKVEDPFNVTTNTVNVPRLTKEGNWDPNDPEFKKGHWCYDTPGTVNKNQILNKMLLPELMKMLPKKMLVPRTFYVPPGMTLFVAGLARIDHKQTEKPIRMTVFTSDQLPVTIVKTEDAEDVYKKALGTPILGVPMGDAERLKEFPPLKPQDFEIQGIGDGTSCSDIVISGAGWVAITAKRDHLFTLTVHTPNGVGLFCRQPSLLPYMIRTRGTLIRGSLSYGKHELYIPGPQHKW